jgi:hypothetical protein
LLRTLINFCSRSLATLEVTSIECQARCTMSLALEDKNQCFSKRNNLDIMLSIFFNHKDSGVWSDVVAT